MVPRRSKKNVQSPPAELVEIDMHQIVSYNLRAGRELRGLTQEQLADRLEPLLGGRPTQATISALERTWDGERRREFDVHEVAVFATALDLPIAWFFLPPERGRRVVKDIDKDMFDLYLLLIGETSEQLEPVYQRLREFGIDDPTPEDEAWERIFRSEDGKRQRNFRDWRKRTALAFLDEHRDDFDRFVETMGDFFDHVREVGVPGFVAARTNDDDFAKPVSNRKTANTEHNAHGAA